MLKKKVQKFVHEQIFFNKFFLSQLNSLNKIKLISLEHTNLLDIYNNSELKICSNLFKRILSYKILLLYNKI